MCNFYILGIIMAEGGSVNYLSKLLIILNKLNYMNKNPPLNPENIEIKLEFSLIIFTIE